jgi:hypothetical protein
VIRVWWEVVGMVREWWREEEVGMEEGDKEKFSRDVGG